MLSRQGLFALLLVVVGCSQPGTGSFPAQGVPAQRVPIEPTSYWGLAWLPGNWLVVEVDPHPHSPGPGNQMWRMRPDGSDLELLKLPKERDCRITEYRNPTTLPDGRLGVIRACYQGNRLFHLPFAYDLRTGDLAPLMGVNLESYFLTVYSWAPTLDRGISSDSSSICATLIWLTRRGVEYPSFSIVDAGRTFTIDERLYPRGASDCQGQPRADAPAWSPDGRTIAFFFSPGSVELTGQARLDAPWDLYLMDPDTLRPQKHLSGLTGEGAEWSPNSRWLVLNTALPDRPEGMWLYEPATRELKFVSRTTASLFAWSPDNTKVATAPGDFSKEHLTIHDLSEIEHQPSENVER